MLQQIFFAISILFLPPFLLTGQTLSSAKKEVKLMGSHFEISAIAINDTIAWKAIETGIEEISRIENLISSWDKDSQTSQINKNAGIKAVVVDKELFDLIYRSKKVSKLTAGAFDISFASMDRIWAFDGQEQSLPDKSLVKQASSKINWQNIILDKEHLSIFLKEKGMKIGFGAIGKGYAANKAKLVMSAISGIKGGLVNASGDLAAWGINTKSSNWSIQIADPKDQSKAIGWLSLKDMSIVTSGDYERFFTTPDGIRYAHIIDPKTGYPTTGIKSVSIICPDTELADALATSVFALGKIQGMQLIDGLNQIECIIITDDDVLLTSKNLNLNYYK